MSEILSSKELEEIRSRAEAATPGEWRVWDNRGKPIFQRNWGEKQEDPTTWKERLGPTHFGVRVDELDGRSFNPLTFDNAQFISHSRQDVLNLINEIKRLRAGFELIKTYGRVCEEFEICEHVACSDSCGAYLVASEILRATEEESG